MFISFFFRSAARHWRFRHFSSLFHSFSSSSVFFRLNFYFTVFNESYRCVLCVILWCVWPYIALLFVTWTIALCRQPVNCLHRQCALIFCLNNTLFRVWFRNLSLFFHSLFCSFRRFVFLSKLQEEKEKAKIIIQTCDDHCSWCFLNGIIIHSFVFISLIFPLVCCFVLCLHFCFQLKWKTLYQIAYNGHIKWQ